MSKGDNLRKSQYVTSVTLSRREAREIPSEISQSFLINHLTLIGTKLPFPPPTVASLPFLLRNPKNLRYNLGCPGTMDLMSKIIDFTYYSPNVDVDILLPDGVRKKLNVPAFTSIDTLFNEAIGDLNIQREVVAFKRTIGDLVLYIPLCNLPISIFNPKGSVFTPEFIFIPKTMDLTRHTAMMLANIVDKYFTHLNVERGSKSDVLDKVSGLVNSCKGPISSSTRKKAQAFLDSIYVEHKYPFLLSRLFRYERNLFCLRGDGMVTVKRGDRNPVDYKASSLELDQLDLENYSFHFGNRKDVCEIPGRDLPQVLELFNVCIAECYRKVPLRTFNFDFPVRSNTDVPRVFADSRVNNIKEEKLQEVIEAQVSLGNRLLSKSVD